jgi:hypothetical protein
VSGGDVQQHLKTGEGLLSVPSGQKISSLTWFSLLKEIQKRQIETGPGGLVPKDHPAGYGVGAAD